LFKLKSFQTKSANFFKEHSDTQTKLFYFLLTDCMAYVVGLNGAVLPPSHVS